MMDSVPVVAPAVIISLNWLPIPTLIELEMSSASQENDLFAATRTRNSPNAIGHHVIHQSQTWTTGLVIRCHFMVDRVSIIQANSMKCN